MEKLLAVTAIGADRTGLVRDLSQAISAAGGSILQSRMTTLGQEFAMLVLVAANWHTLQKVEDALARCVNSCHSLRSKHKETLIPC